MKKLMIIALLALSFQMFGQSGLRIVEPDTGQVKERVVAQMSFCLPLVEANDTLVTLFCDGIMIGLPMERINGETTIIIHPNDEDGPLTFKKVVHWYMAPKSYYRDSLGINLY